MEEEIQMMFPTTLPAPPAVCRWSCRIERDRCFRLRWRTHDGGKLTQSRFQKQQSYILQATSCTFSDYQAKLKPRVQHTSPRVTAPQAQAAAVEFHIAQILALVGSADPAYPPNTVASPVRSLVAEST